MMPLCLSDIEISCQQLVVTLLTTALLQSIAIREQQLLEDALPQTLQSCPTPNSPAARWYLCEIKHKTAMTFGTSARRCRPGRWLHQEVKSFFPAVWSPV